MCLTPVKIKTNAKYFSLGSYKRLTFTVPCGHCAECQQQRKNEWYLRNYFEATSTWSKGGYVLFDTLTYSDKYLPTFSHTVSREYGEDIFTNIDYSDIQEPARELYNSLIPANPTAEDLCNANVKLTEFVQSEMLAKDFSCFDYHDVQKFLKRLRINLSRDGYHPESCLRYFLSSEYGHEESYIDDRGRHRTGTMRPHYHVLFYVTDPKLDALTLSEYVSDAWFLGRTDGVAYRGRAYVYNNAFGPAYIKDPSRLAGVQYYVTKYVTKDYEFEEKIDARIVTALKRWFMLDPTSPEYFQKRRELHRFMDQFHRQSVGFGAQALLNPEVLDSIMNEFVIKVPDKVHITKSIPVPMYYVRKMFQRCVQDSEGTLHWIWTDCGREWKKSRVLNNVSVLAKKMQDWYDNLDVILGDRFEADARRRKVGLLLRSRSWEDYARYIILYQERFYLDDSLPDAEEMLDHSLRADSDSSPYLVRRREDGTIYMLSADGYECDTTFDELSMNCVIDERFSTDFQAFDQLQKLYNASLRLYNIERQRTYERKIEEQKLLKSLGFKAKKRL